MQSSKFQDYIAACDTLKARHRCKLSNIFLDNYGLHQKLTQKDCQLHATSGALFLLIPYHSNAYYDCLYLAADADRLNEGLESLLGNIHLDQDIRASIVAKEPMAGGLAGMFQHQGFELTKKLIRTQSTQAAPARLKAMGMFAEEYQDCMSFAILQDAEEILEILKENFDLVADNIPELEAIRENILQKQVVVLRQDGKIASLRYFRFINNTYHGLYEVTREEYRNGAFYMALMFFAFEHFEALGKQNVRSLGWVDASREKLWKHYQKIDRFADGVVIYNMLLKHQSSV